MLGGWWCNHKKILNIQNLKQSLMKKKWSYFVLYSIRIYHSLNVSSMNEYERFEMKKKTTKNNIDYDF